MDTLLVDLENWDLCVDAAGHIAVAGAPYAMAQGAACAIKSFRGENYYDTGQGVPYFSQILGKSPPLSLVKARLVEAALSVPDVVKAKVFVSAIGGGEVSGQVQIVDAQGAVSIAGF